MKYILPLVLIILLVPTGLWGFGDVTPRDSVKITFILIGIGVTLLVIADVITSLKR